MTKKGNFNGFEVLPVSTVGRGAVILLVVMAVLGVLFPQDFQQVTKQLRELI